MSNLPELSMALVGAGRIGAIHGGNIARRIAGVRLAAVVDIDLEAAEKIAAENSVDQIDADYRAVLDDPAIDAVAICSATDTHAEIVQQAAKAGKHIFCEKPIDFDLARIDASLEAVEKAGVKFQVGFNRRFDSNFKKVRDAVAAGDIGEPHLLHIISRDPAPPPIEYIKVSGGIFLDMTIHDFDMARYLTGSEIEEVYVSAGVMVDPSIGKAGDVDTAIIMLRFENGMLGTIDNSRQAVYGYDQRVEVFGSAGAIRTENNKPDTHIRSDDQGVYSAKPLYFFLERYTASYLEEMRQFVEAVRKDEPTPVEGIDGRIPVVIGLAARASLDQNRPVRVSEFA